MLAGLSLFLSGCSSTGSATRIYQMGERAEVGSLVYSVLECRWATQFGEGAGSRTPRDRFLLLRLSVTNSSSREVSVPLTAVETAGGSSFDELTQVEGVPEWLGVLRKLKPVETVFGWVVFDVPQGDYKLRVADDALIAEEARTALIEVPLRFGRTTDFLPTDATGR